MKYSKMLTFFSLNVESLKSVFTIVLIDFGSIIKSQTIFIMERLGFLLTLSPTALMLLYVRHEWGHPLLDDLWCCRALCTSSPHHKLWILDTFSCFIIFDIGVPARLSPIMASSLVILTANYNEFIQYTWSGINISNKYIR